MKHAALIALSALAAGCMTEEPVERAGPTPEAVLAATEGRVAGPAVPCVSQSLLRSHRIVAGAMLFEGAGDVVWVNDGGGSCQALAFGRAIRTRTPSSQLCRGDIVTAFEPVSGTEYGGCVLGDFVPYRRTD